jgi:hypothetical protein
MAYAGNYGFDVEQKTTEALELIAGIYIERSTVNGRITFRVDERGKVSLKLDRVFPEWRPHKKGSTR